MFCSVKSSVYSAFFLHEQYEFIMCASYRQITGKLNHAQPGIYFVWRGAVSSSFLISLFSHASLMRRDMLADDFSSRPKRILRELFVKNSPSNVLYARVHIASPKFILRRQVKEINLCKKCDLGIFFIYVNMRCW